MMAPKKAVVSKTREVHTYAELWHGSRVLLERAQADPKGCYWLWMASLVFSAFSLEAYLNHIGSKLFRSWNALERLSPEEKLLVVCEKLNLEFDSGVRPLNTIRQLFKFRNDVAHGKTVTVREDDIVDINEYLDKYLGQRPLATWEKYCTEQNAELTREDVEKVIRKIHDTAKPEDDPAFFFGIAIHSATVQENS